MKRRDFFGFFGAGALTGCSVMPADKPKPAPSRTVLTEAQEKELGLDTNPDNTISFLTAGRMATWKIGTDGCMYLQENGQWRKVT